MNAAMATENGTIWGYLYPKDKNECTEHIELIKDMYTFGRAECKFALR